MLPLHSMLCKLEFASLPTNMKQLLFNLVQWQPEAFYKFSANFKATNVTYLLNIK